MCNNGFGGCSWIILIFILVLWCVCGNGCGGNNGCSNDCGCNSGCGC